MLTFPSGLAQLPCTSLLAHPWFSPGCSGQHAQPCLFPVSYTSLPTQGPSQEPELSLPYSQHPVLSGAPEWSSGNAAWTLLAPAGNISKAPTVESDPRDHADHSQLMCPLLTPHTTVAPSPACPQFTSAWTLVVLFLLSGMSSLL